MSADRDLEIVTEDTRALIGFGLCLVLYGAFSLSDVPRVRARLAAPDAVATAPATIQSVRAERVFSLLSRGGRGSAPYACKVVTEFVVDGRRHHTRKPYLYDRARNHRSPASASGYCERRYAVGAEVRVTYLEADPEVASIEARDFGRRLMPALQALALVSGLGFSGFGVWMWRRETDAAQTWDRRAVPRQRRV